MKNSRKNESKFLASPDRYASRFPIVAACTSLLILAIQLVRSSNSESWDRLIYLSSILLAVVITISRANLYSNTALLALGAVSLAIGVIGVEKHGTETTSGVDVSNMLWLGFGWVVFLALLFTTFLYLKFYFREERPIWLRTLGVLAFLYSTSLALLAAWQTTSSIIDNYHSEYVINEALAVPAGHIPYVDFIPQYGLLFSFLLKPFSNNLSPDELVNALYFMCYGSILVTLFIAVLLVRSNLSKKSWIVATLWVVPFTCLAHLPNRKGYSGTIFSLISQIPVRIFPGMIIAILTISALARLNTFSRKKANLQIAFVSFLSGLGFWINQDFVLLSGLICVAMIIFFSKNMKLSFVSLAGYIFGVLTYPVLVQLSGNTVQFKYVGFFAVQYGGAFMAEEIITPGPVLIVLPVIVSLAAYAFSIYIKTAKLDKSLSSEDYRRTLTITFFSVWCVGGFLYYLNRSYASGQMQILFLPLSIALASFAHLSFWKEYFLKTSLTRESNQKRVNYKVIFPVISAMLFALPFATVVASSDPRIEWKRISTSPEGHTWPKENSKEAISIWSELQKDSSIRKSDVAYFGASGNYVELMTGVRSINILNSPFDIPVTPVTIQTGCDAIFKYNPEYLIVGIEGRSLFRFENNTLCNRYQFINYGNLPLGTVAKRIG